MNKVLAWVLVAGMVLATICFTTHSYNVKHERLAKQGYCEVAFPGSSIAYWQKCPGIK